MIYLKMDAHKWISCTGWSASPLLTSFPVSRLWAGRQAGRQADSQLKLLNLSSPKNEPYAIFSAIFTFTNIENVSSGRSVKSA